MVNSEVLIVLLIITMCAERVTSFGHWTLGMVLLVLLLWIFKSLHIGRRIPAYWKSICRLRDYWPKPCLATVAIATFPPPAFSVDELPMVTLAQLRWYEYVIRPIRFIIIPITHDDLQSEQLEIVSRQCYGELKRTIWRMGYCPPIVGCYFDRDGQLPQNTPLVIQLDADNECHKACDDYYQQLIQAQLVQSADNESSNVQTWLQLDVIHTLLARLLQFFEPSLWRSIPVSTLMLCPSSENKLITLASPSSSTPYVSVSWRFWGKRFAYFLPIAMSLCLMAYTVIETRAMYRLSQAIAVEEVPSAARDAQMIQHLPSRLSDQYRATRLKQSFLKTVYPWLSQSLATSCDRTVAIQQRFHPLQQLHWLLTQNYAALMSSLAENPSLKRWFQSRSHQRFIQHHITQQNKLRVRIEQVLLSERNNVIPLMFYQQHRIQQFSLAVWQQRVLPTLCQTKLSLYSIKASKHQTTQQDMIHHIAEDYLQQAIKSLEHQFQFASYPSSPQRVQWLAHSDHIQHDLKQFTRQFHQWLVLKHTLGQSPKQLCQAASLPSVATPHLTALRQHLAQLHQDIQALHQPREIVTYLANPRSELYVFQRFLTHSKLLVNHVPSHRWLNTTSQQMLDDLWLALTKTVVEYLNQQWRESLHEYQQELSDRFPFQSKAQASVELTSLKQLLSPTGTIAQFMQRVPKRLKLNSHVEEVVLDLNARQRIQQLQMLLTPRQGKLTLEYTVMAVPHPAISVLTLASDGVSYQYHNERQTWKKQQWEWQQQLAFIKADGLDNQPVAYLEVSGPFAWWRLIGQMQIIPLGAHQYELHYRECVFRIKMPKQHDLIDRCLLHPCRLPSTLFGRQLPPPTRDA